MIWDALLEFLIRLAFGLSLGIICVPSSHAPAGFFRVHLWVLMGMYTVAALLAAKSGYPVEARRVLLSCCIAAAILPYVGAVVWLYDRVRAGVFTVWIIAGLGLIAAMQGALETTPGTSEAATISSWLWAGADTLSASCVLGFTMAAMLLGHWYLNAPGMQLSPLWILLTAIGFSLAFRAAVAGAGLVLLVGQEDPLTLAFGAIVALRWLAGIVGIGVLVMMTRQTLKIPNTQSATGILYVAVVFSFLGELAAQLVAAGKPYPL